ncbi:MAG: cephalosporin hydroxylase family protein [Fibrobacterota bacterium]|nr:cephalosporin hydroxylase family protein [Fibrobacterota bacterium]QQS07070.1 MAG: cephalosporin hydroxylase family protein [Fibrobacterota bacterium]
MDPVARFQQEKTDRIAAYRADARMKTLSNDYRNEAIRRDYEYNFTWMGRPIIQFPQDIVAMQELIWQIKPDLIVETGIAHGGSLVFSASMLQLLGGDGIAVGVDIEIRPHNRTAIEEHPMSGRIRMIEGSSIDPEIVRRVKELAKGRKRILVALDSNHTHDHVLSELRAYHDLVTPGSYLVVFDTVIEDMPADLSGDRPWKPGDNAKTAVHQFLTENDKFEIDHDLEAKLLLTVAPDGYLRRKI